MPVPGDDRFFTELRGCTAELARIIDGDLERPVPTCPGWTFRQLATHVGRGHRWAAQIVATRATTPIPTREVADGKLPSDPAQHAPWLNAGAEQVILLEDVLSETRYERSGRELSTRGLYLDLPAWSYHVFDCRTTA